jgi:hypothetical protein
MFNQAPAGLAVNRMERLAPTLRCARTEVNRKSSVDCSLHCARAVIFDGTALVDPLDYSTDVLQTTILRLGRLTKTRGRVHGLFVLICSRSLATCLSNLL